METDIFYSSSFTNSKSIGWTQGFVKELHSNVDRNVADSVGFITSKTLHVARQQKFQHIRATSHLKRCDIFGEQRYKFYQSYTMKYIFTKT